MSTTLCIGLEEVTTVNSIVVTKPREGGDNGGCV
jgi:hypothetical protein